MGVNTRPNAVTPIMPENTAVPSVWRSSAPAPMAQTSGMTRREAVSGKTVGSEKVWMGQTHVEPATKSANHHHGESETAIYVVSGHPEFVFLDGGEELGQGRIGEGHRRDLLCVHPARSCRGSRR